MLDNGDHEQGGGYPCCFLEEQQEQPSPRLCREVAAQAQLRLPERKQVSHCLPQYPPDNQDECHQTTLEQETVQDQETTNSPVKPQPPTTLRALEFPLWKMRRQSQGGVACSAATAVFQDQRAMYIVATAALKELTITHSQVSGTFFNYVSGLYSRQEPQQKPAQPRLQQCNSCIERTHSCGSAFLECKSGLLVITTA